MPLFFLYAVSYGYLWSGEALLFLCVMAYSLRIAHYKLLGHFSLLLLERYSFVAFVSYSIVYFDLNIRWLVYYIYFVDGLYLTRSMVYSVVQRSLVISCYNLFHKITII